MSQRTRLAKLEDVAAERDAKNNSCICRLVFLDAGQPLTEEQTAILEHNAKCPSLVHHGFNVVEVTPQMSED